MIFNNVFSTIFFGATAHSSSKGARFQGAEITWLGHATFHIKSPEGKDILIDPWLENPKAPSGAMDNASADIIMLTHGHFDHVGNTVEIAQKTGATVISNFEISNYLASEGVNEDKTIGMNIGGTVNEQGIKFTMTNAVHSSGISTENGIVDGGDPAGVVIELENGFKFYHTGDTDLFSDMKLIGKLYSPDVMLACIGDHFTMGPKSAAMAVEMVSPKYVIPMHYGTFGLLTGTPDKLVEHLPKNLKNCVITATPGETIT